MSNRDREKRRARRLEKTKKKRATASRAGNDGPKNTATSDTSRGRTWPTGECYVSDGWDEPGARSYAVLSRTNGDGATVVASFVIDRSGPGLVSTRSRGGLTREQVSGECARVSEEAGGVAMIEAAPGLVAALVSDARVLGSNEDPPGSADALALLAGIAPIEIDVPFGTGTEEGAPPERKGWLSGLRKRLFG